ncbi:MAG: hypothetical protein PHH71_01860 [Clostridia bacterium]|jgi:hypothetical protein|nr:hypothetical protein [Clostridia bacterium]MDD4408678.1 hypothetical protein [Clostridia bacterium]
MNQKMRTHETNQRKIKAQIRIIKVQIQTGIQNRIQTEMIQLQTEMIQQVLVLIPKVQGAVQERIHQTNPTINFAG